MCPRHLHCSAPQVWIAIENQLHSQEMQLPVHECEQEYGLQVPDLVGRDANVVSSPALSFHYACTATNSFLHASSIDDSMSGTTAVCALLNGNELTVSNVGDSRGVLAEKREGKLVAVDLSRDQTPMCEDERERCVRAGASVMSIEQAQGLKHVGAGWTAEVRDRRACRHCCLHDICASITANW